MRCAQSVPSSLSCPLQPALTNDERKASRMDEPVEETSLPDEHLAQLLCSSELLRHQLIVENAALKRRMKPSKAEYVGTWAQSTLPAN